MKRENTKVLLRAQQQHCKDIASFHQLETDLEETLTEESGGDQNVDDDETAGSVTDIDDDADAVDVDIGNDDAKVGKDAEVDDGMEACNDVGSGFSSSSEESRLFSSRQLISFLVADTMLSPTSGELPRVLSSESIFWPARSSLSPTSVNVFCFGLSITITTTFSSTGRTAASRVVLHEPAAVTWSSSFLASCRCRWSLGAFLTFRQVISHRPVAV
jgi:hypothetical protein